MTDGWNYVAGFSVERREALAAAGSFEDLIRLVRDDAHEIKARAQPGSDRGLTDCIQPIFTFDLPNTGDALFNGPWGYRAEYWISPEQGLAANTRLLAMLTPKLLGAIDLDASPDFAKIDVCASLHAASAKIWIREGLSILSDPVAELAVDRWLRAARNGVELARLGLSAPQATKFEVKGALIDPYGNEVVPARKIRRHYDIYHYGFS
jgi:hypothetical protein